MEKSVLNGDPQAQVTPLEQLPFFIWFLKMGHIFEPWVDECLLRYAGNNAPKKVNVLGSLLLTILAGHNRYAHITSLMGDSVNSKLLGMTKVGHYWIVYRARNGPLLFGAIVTGVATPS